MLLLPVKDWISYYPTLSRNLRESPFYFRKNNMGFRRFQLRGLEKAKTELGLVSIAHN